jgi:hypothetical protein
MSGASSTGRSSEQKEPDSGGEQQRFAGSYREPGVEDESGSDGANDEHGDGGDGDGSNPDLQLREGDDPQ